MKACILAVGSEMLTPFRVDTNSLHLTERLNTIGYDVRLKAIVGDDVDELARVLHDALSWSDLVVVHGRPRTDRGRHHARRGCARARPRRSTSTRQSSTGFASGLSGGAWRCRRTTAGRPWCPRGATLLDNPNGTAPGLWIERGSAAIVLLPGPPREMKPMFEMVLRDRLAPRSGTSGVFRRTLKITGRAESDVDAAVQPIYSRWMTQADPDQHDDPRRARTDRAASHRVASDPPAANAALDAAVNELQAALGPAVYSTDGRGLEAVVGELLRERRLTMAVAESCTGGLLASRLTDVPGSSEYVDRGVVCYSNEAKSELVGVPAELIAEHGAVSEPVARAMADGIRARSRANVGIGITGIAGPSGGTDQKPVGTVAIAVVGDDAATVRTFNFLGGREMVKFQASQAAMNMLRLMLMQASGVREWTERR